MKLQFLLEPAYDMLLDNIEANQDRYLSGVSWVPEYFAGNNFSKESSIEIQRPDLVKTPDITDDTQKSLDDLANVRIIYDALRSLTPLQSTNKYLWTYLSHITYREYVHQRWMTTPSDVPVRTIKTRYFVTGNTNSLYDNAISRLWWYGYISYDAETPRNPYHLTQILLMNQTICSDFVDTRYCHNRIVGKGVLLALKDFSAELGLREGITDYFRAFNKYFNRYAAVSNIDFLDAEDIRQIAFKYLMDARNARLKAK